MSQQSSMVDGDATAARIELKQVSKSYGHLPVVDEFSLQVKSGEFLTLLGSSGCGKTTILKMIAGLETVSQGQIWMAGGDITALPPYDRQIGLVFQDYALFPHLSIEDNIAFGLKMQRISQARRRQRAREMLDFVQLPQVAKRKPHQLSGGQRQRVALARALILEPAVLLLDEPLGALDAELRRQMQGDLKRIQTQLGMTFIYVTHDQEEALTMSDRIVIMRQGKIEQIGTPHDIYETPKNRFVAQFIGQCNFGQGPIIERHDQHITIEDPHLGKLNAVLPSSASLENQPFNLGQTISILVRPEKIRVRFPASTEVSPDWPEKTILDKTMPDKTTSENHLSGVITALVYAGPITRLSVDIGNIELRVDSHGPGSWQIGDRVMLSWLAKDAVPLADLQPLSQQEDDRSPSLSMRPSSSRQSAYTSARG